MEHHVWIARRLTLTQREALRALAEGRVHATSVPTMRALIRRGLVADQRGMPAVTAFGLDVVGELPRPLS